MSIRQLASGRKRGSSSSPRPGRSCRTLIEICVWGGFYFWTDSFPDLQTAFYFSAVTCTTTGYGDLVLPEEWRLVELKSRRSQAS